MSKSHEKKQDAIQEKAFKAEKDRKVYCLHPGCNNKSEMRSHILQEHGILNYIAPDGNFMEFTEAGLFHPASRLNSEGVNNTDLFTFRGLCGEHDNDNYSTIEDNDCEFDTYKEQLLLSYRALLNELAHTEVVIRYHSKLLENKSLDYDRKKRIQDGINGSVKWILSSKNLRYRKRLMEQELWGGDSNLHFKFHRRVLPKVEIATSAIFSGGFRKFTTRINALAIDPLSKGFIPSTQSKFLHLIPRKSDTLLIIGYVNEVTHIKGVSVNEIDSLSDEQILKFISDIIVSIGTWGISKELYNKWSGLGIVDNILLVRQKWLEGSPPESADFNMFKGTVC